VTEAETRQFLSALHEESFCWAISCARGQRTMAEDILQRAYAKALSGRASFGHRSNFKTWFFAVIRRTGQEIHRREAISRLFLGRLRDFAEPATPILSPADEADRDGTAARRRARSVRFRLITAAVSCGVVIVAALTIGVRDQTEDSDLGPILFAETSTSVLANLVLPPACPDTEAFAQIVDTEWSSPTGFFLDLEPEEPESESG